MIESQKTTNWVDAIDGGRIVRVTEEHAHAEGLPIIRRPLVELQQFSAEKARLQPMSAREKKGLLRFEEFRRPLKGDKGIVSELKENFHWEIIRLRKAKGITRKQLAEALGASEYDIKMIENGVLVKEDYSLINSIQKYFNINLRKDGRNDFISPLQQALAAKRTEKKPEEKPAEKTTEDTSEAKEVLSGEDIEIEDDDDW